MVLDVRDGHRDAGEHHALGLAFSARAAQNILAQPAARLAAQLVCRWSRTEQEQEADRLSKCERYVQLSRGKQFL